MLNMTTAKQNNEVVFQMEAFQ